MLLCLLALSISAASACGPWFPNTLLDGGDAALLTAPKSSFRGELQRMRLVSPAFRAVVATNSHPEETCDADIADLRLALRRLRVDDDKSREIVAAYTVERVRLRDAAEAAQAWTSSGEIDWSSGRMKRVHNQPRPTLENWPKLTPGLPAEFSDYFTGSVAWHAGLTNDARADWADLLRLPAGERHYRSTWAAYMLGRSWHDEDPDQAIGYYQQVRALAKEGFADRLGLAVASMGWEAQLLWRKKHHEEAIELYLDQLAAGDESAVNSLRFVAGEVFKLGPTVMQPLAANARTRRVVTAFVISTSGYELQFDSGTDAGEDSDHRLNKVAGNWLAALEAANINDVESAEQLALAAYRWGQWDVAQRWINRARSSPVTQWLQAKLLLRAGRVDQAAAMLSSLTRQFPLAPRDTNSPAPKTLSETLRMEPDDYNDYDPKTAAQQVWGEFGVFCLARRDYTEALDALLRADFWPDAAYVAERVLTADELRSYVDQNWPAPEKKEPSAEKEWNSYRADNGTKIRYLLARRLARLGRYAEARSYFPEEWQPHCDELRQSLERGADESRPAAERALSLFAAACTTRTNGIELIGTEVEPDWAIHGGNFEVGVTVKSRLEKIEDNKVHATEDEISRDAAHGVTPEVRWHYRDRAAVLGMEAARLSRADFRAMSDIIFTSRAWLQDPEVETNFYRAAAELGWQAAKDLPDNSDEKARVLCTAGSWIKYWSPKEADAFYKALVRKCGKTAIGRQADVMRWFPTLDESGNLVPWHPRPPTEWTGETAQPVEHQTPDDPTQPPPPPKPPIALPDAPGFIYVLHRGNTISDLVDAVRIQHGLNATVQDILAANPEVNPKKLKPGMKIFVPLAVEAGISPQALMDLLNPPTRPPSTVPPAESDAQPQ